MKKRLKIVDESAEMECAVELRGAERNAGHGARGSGRKPAGAVAVVMHLLGRLGVGARQKPAPRMKLIETLALGGRRELKLVECWGRRYMVGCGAESVQTIAAVETGAVRSAGEAMGRGMEGPRAGFDGQFTGSAMTRRTESSAGEMEWV